MAERRYVSTAQIAAAVGVSVTTVKRWVDQGILPAYRTPGGHRKLPLVDVVRVLREGDFPQMDWSQLDLPPQDRPPDTASLAERLLSALRGRDPAAAGLVLQEAHQGGLSTASMADEVVAPAMTRLGHEWERGRIDVFHEHRGTQMCLTALITLKADLETNVSGRRPLAIGGGPEGDFYQLANFLAEMVLLEAGWEVVALGPNTPLLSFRKALDELRPRLLWLSVSHLVNPETFRQEYRLLYEYAVRTGAAVALGGRALTEEVRADLPYTNHGDRMAHLAAFARSLHARPTRRPRGRPR